MKNKFTDSYLKELLNEVRLSGWMGLSRGEKIALSRYCRKNGITLPNAQSLSESFGREVQAHSNKPVYQTEPETVETPDVEAAPVEEPAPADTPEETPRPAVDEVKKNHPSKATIPISQLLFDDNGKHLGTFAEHIQPTPRPMSFLQQYYVTIAHKLLDYPGKWLIMSHVFISKKHAQGFASDIRLGKTSTWQAKNGAYEASYQHINGKHFVAVRYMPNTKE